MNSRGDVRSSRPAAIDPRARPRARRRGPRIEPDAAGSPPERASGVERASCAARPGARSTIRPAAIDISRQVYSHIYKDVRSVSHGYVMHSFPSPSASL